MQMQTHSVCIVVDPVSTGGAVAQEIYSRGYKMIRCWSDEVGDLKSHIPSVAKDIDWLATVELAGSLAQLADECRRLADSEGLQLAACIVGCESGVILADSLSTALGLRSNGVCPSRRNKSWQQKRVKEAGLRATREASGISLSDPAVAAFLASERYPIIVKPTESAGSDGVKKCSSREEAEAHFQLLMKAQRRLGSADAAVICQEFLAGAEYVVDHVSLEGEHKTVMIWRYDRAPCNGGDFVLFGMVPVPSNAPEAKELIVYTRGVIDALGLRHGPTHAEVMLTADGPCLVEMNCRAHGADGTWASLARALTGGFSQVDATADAFLDHSAFARLPSVYNELGDFKAAGQLVQLVSCYDGIIASLAPLGAIRALDSFQYMQVAEAVAPGKMLEKTVDLFTGIGFVILCHADPASVERDVATIRKMEKEGPLVELLEASSSEDEDAVAVHQSDRALDDALATVDLTKRLSRNSASSPTGVAAEGSGCVPVGIGA